VCDSGRTFQIDFVTGAGTAHGFGIGKDSQADIYKFIFCPFFRVGPFAAQWAGPTRAVADSGNKVGQHRRQP